MSFLTDLFNPPQNKPSATDQYRFDESVYTTLQALTYVMNPSTVSNANFATLGPSGTTAITQADGDSTVRHSGWSLSVLLSAKRE